jgi:hypothetical protein
MLTAHVKFLQKNAPAEQCRRPSTAGRASRYGVVQPHFRNTTMHKVAALALAALVATTALGFAKPAEARVYVGVGIDLPFPGVALAPPLVAYPGVYAPYYDGYRGPRYYHRSGFARYGYGYRGYGYRHGRWR